MSGRSDPMAKGTFWVRVRKYFRDLAKDMERDSVSAAGSSPSACCHVPVEELDRRRETYRAEAEERKKSRIAH